MGRKTARQARRLPWPVSIQLVSPASGEAVEGGQGRLSRGQGFHSISFPSEWGEGWPHSGHVMLARFHSISFPSEWGVQAKIDGLEEVSKFPFN